MMKKAVIVIAIMGMVVCALATDLEFVRELVAIPSASADIPQVNRAMRLKAQGRGGHSARPWECDVRPFRRVAVALPRRSRQVCGGSLIL